MSETKTSTYNPNRISKSSTNPEELALRKESSRQLVHDLLGDSGELFDDPQTRLDFLADQSPEKFYEIAQYINRSMRGMTPAEMRNQAQDKGGFLQSFHTPTHEHKLDAFYKGFEVIREYITHSEDTIDTKLEGVSMATEALVIWVHPFDDGNGRTSRFLGEFIEHGTHDIDKLIATTADQKHRYRFYEDTVTSRQSRLNDANNIDLMIEDNEREALRKEAHTYPDDPEAVALSVKRLLEDGEIREKSNQYQHYQRPLLDRLQ